MDHRASLKPLWTNTFKRTDISPGQQSGSVGQEIWLGKWMDIDNCTTTDIQTNRWEFVVCDFDGDANVQSTRMLEANVTLLHGIFLDT
jgi:hypothetical protein